MRQVNILLDDAWTEPLPILAWAIETSDGVVVVDTGETAGTKEPGYFPRWHPYFRLAVRLDVEPEQEIGPQLLVLGIRSADVRTVIMTHLHTDHAGGMGHFPNAKILVSAEELRLAKGFMGRVRGYLPNRWPSWFAPTTIAFDSPPFDPFGRCQRVTSDGKVIIVATPGHTPGHVSVIFQDEEASYFLAGDTTFRRSRFSMNPWTESAPANPSLERHSGRSWTMHEPIGWCTCHHMIRMLWTDFKTAGSSP